MKFNASSFTIVITLGFIAAGCSEKNTFVEPPPPEVTVSKPEIRDITVFQGYSGRLLAKETIEIRARANGYLRSVDFKDGQRVQQGDQLFVIEPEPFQAKLASAEAKIAETKANEEIAQADFDRRSKAFETRAVAELDVLESKANLQAAKAGVLAAKASLKQAVLDLSYTTNTAPAMGRLGRKLVSVGNLVGGPQPTLLTTLIVEDPIHVYFSVPERVLIPFLGKAIHLKTNQFEPPPVKLELADGTIYEKPGRWDFMDNQVDSKTGTISMRAVFPNENGQLLSGLYGKILIPRTVTNAVLVADLSIQRDLGGTFVMVVDSDNKVDGRYVEIGTKVDDQRIITEGLTGDERVIIRGIQRARPGIKVTPVSSSESPGSPKKNTSPKL
ncbi:MAG TPA: efflux RND transporter periplasmic adaptor subunit [Verrucomicrobiales bacterium]|nr:efflux RND transporter periplasmic adaptor subunit [Verrucomicrobiales bacterium]HIL70893.1 efflux RND transporter periplasmic adaptor subunit [Verrucomicrobiota bacterium]